MYCDIWHWHAGTFILLPALESQSRCSCKADHGCDECIASIFLVACSQVCLVLSVFVGHFCFPLASCLAGFQLDYQQGCSPHWWFSSICVLFSVLVLVVVSRNTGFVLGVIVGTHLDVP